MHHPLQSQRLVWLSPLLPFTHFPSLSQGMLQSVAEGALDLKLCGHGSNPSSTAYQL